MDFGPRAYLHGVLELRSLKHRVDLHAIDATSARRRGPRSPIFVPAGNPTDFYHPDDYENKHDGLVPFGNPDGVTGQYWGCGNSAFDAVFEVLLEHMSKEEWAMFGTEFIKIAWTDDMSREMKLRGFLRTLSRCLTVAAETTRQHVMMACFPSPNSSAWNGSGASTLRHRRDAFTPTVLCAGQGVARGRATEGARRAARRRGVGAARAARRLERRRRAGRCVLRRRARRAARRRRRVGRRRFRW